MELVNPAPCLGIKDVPVYRVPVVVGAVKNILADLVADIAGAFCGVIGNRVLLQKCYIA